MHFSSVDDLWQSFVYLNILKLTKLIDKNLNEKNLLQNGENFEQFLATFFKNNNKKNNH